MASKPKPNEKKPAAAKSARATPSRPRSGGLGAPGAPIAPRTIQKPNSGFLNVRLLPVTIFVAALMLSVRVTDIWKGVYSPSAVSVSELEAQQPPPPGGRKRGQRTPASEANGALSQAQTPTSAAPTTAPTQPTAPQTGVQPATLPGAPPPVVPPANSAAEGEPPSFTPSEIDVLQNLSARREALDNRERELTLRENLIKAAEARIDKKVAEMKALQSNVEGMLKQVDDQDDKKMTSLVKIYENMKPKDAARIFEQLDTSLQLGVVGKMKEQKFAPIMEAMDPMKAKLLTDAMATKRAAKTEGQGG